MVQDPIDLNVFFQQSSAKKRDFPLLILNSMNHQVVYAHTGRGTGYDKIFSVFLSWKEHPIWGGLLSSLSNSDNKTVQNWLEIVSDETLVELMMPEDIVKMAPSFTITWENGQNYEIRFEAIRTGNMYQYVMVWLKPHGETQEQKLAAEIIELMRELRHLPREILKNLREYLPEAQESLSLKHYEKFFRELTLIEHIARSVHAAKGTFFFLGLTTIGDVCHNVESQLEQLRENWVPDHGIQPIKDVLNQLFLLITLTEGIITRVQNETTDSENVVISADAYYALLEKSSQIQLSIRQNQFSISGISEQLALLHQQLIGLDSVPLSSLFEKLHTSTSKLTKELHKSADFVAHCEHDINISHRLMESLWNAFYQILKNSIDHGIESADARQKIGKPASARIVLSITLLPEALILCLEDDGKGINPADILATARLKQMISEQEADILEAEQNKQKIFDLLFLPRFTTQKKVTSVSGRGMGTNVVKEEVEKYRGSIAVDSIPGQWTKFVVRLPLEGNMILVHEPQE
ncbi:MAG: Hpt domain-containing protein [SAR324 cluster bacterium]|nr:Hpt domain-containing protein [SAR324 cluster bacterium]